MASQRFPVITAVEFERLFEKYFDDVSSFLYSYASSEAELKDWVQEVFIKLWEKRGRIDFYHPSFKSYLLKTARNHALKKMRQEKNYTVWLEENLIQLTVNDTTVYNEENDFSPLLQAAYSEALTKIPSRARKTWRLSREDGLSYSEISKVMGVSVKTVETQISKALRILREELGNKWEG